jgi:hypothetical protein
MLRGEGQPVRITDHVQDGHPVLASENYVFDQQPSDAVPPEVWLDEQSVEVHLWTFARHVGEQGIAIPGVVKRCTTLQRFKRLALGHDRRANEDIVRHTK